MQEATAELSTEAEYRLGIGPGLHPQRVGDAGRPGALAFPRVPVRLVSRPGLLQRLDRLAAMTVIEAPPGFGKTTLVAAWVREQQRLGTRVVWLRASTELNEMSALREALRRGLLLAEVLSGAGSAQRDPDPGTPGWIEELAGSQHRVMVVLDDAHLLTDPALAQYLVRLVMLAPSVHVVVLADSGHRFHVAAERHGVETNVLHGGDLSVTADEVPVFAEAWGHRLSGESARLLHSLVGGWLLPLRLILDATPSGSEEFATHAAVEFLKKRVLPALSDEELSGSLRLAVPDYVTVDLAAAVLGGEGSPRESLHPAHEVIDALDRHDLLWRVPRNDGVLEWQFPALVRRALREELKRSDPQSARAAHHQVAQVLADSGSACRGELLRHARASEDWMLLAQLWRREGWWLAGAEPEAFVFAYAGMPPAARQQNPSLMLAASLAEALAATSSDVGWRARAEALLRHYMETGIAFVQNRGQVADPSELAQLLTAGMVAFRSEGHLQEASQLATEAARQVLRARAVESPRLTAEQDSWFHLQRGLLEMHGGAHDLAVEKVVTAYEVTPSRITGASAAALLSAIHAISGERPETQRWLEAHEAVDLTAHWAAGLAQLPARLTRAMLALDQLDTDKAEVELAEVPLGSEAVGIWPLILTVHTRHALLAGEPMAMLSRLDHARRGLSRYLRHPHGFGRQVLERCSIDVMLALGEVHRVQSRLNRHHQLPHWLCTAAARFHLITGNTHEAVRIAAISVRRHDVHVRDRQELLVIGALAFERQGDTDQMLKNLRQAHALGNHTGSLQPLLALPSARRHELLGATGLRLSDDDLARLDATPPIYPEHAELVPLSPRELEVLHRLPEHETAQGVANSLTVSVNTIKRHLASLYAKLGVHDRASALQRAQSLGLTSDHDHRPRGPEEHSSA